MGNTIITTRHPALVQLLSERGIITGDEAVMAHATPDDVMGRHVVGVLPLSLAALAASVTEVPLALAPEDRGRELGIERLREVAGDAVTYVVAERDKADASLRRVAEQMFDAGAQNVLPPMPAIEDITGDVL